MRRHDGQSLNSVAVETTFDLANFDASSSGNCYWPSAENFSHTQTQTICDANTLEQWFSTDVQTQTCKNRPVAASRLQESNWTHSSSGEKIVCGKGAMKKYNPLIQLTGHVAGGRSSNNLNFIRFSSIVSISEIRIIPFGSVVESKQSDEGVIGTTNPDKFKIRFYCYNDTTAPTLFQIAEFNYNESKGINIVPLPQPVPSNILLLRGDYSTITVAVFGLPYFPALQQTGIAVPNFSVPPPPLVPSGPGFPLMGSVRPPFTNQVPTVSFGQSRSESSKAQPPVDTPNVSRTSGYSNIYVSPAAKEEPLATVSNEPQPNIEKKDSKEDEYEQEILNKPKVSNKEAIQMGDDIKSENILALDDPLMKPAKWTFNPVDLLDMSEVSLPAVKRKRLPNPSFALYEIYRWVLQSDGPNSMTLEESYSNLESSDLSMLGTPPSDRSNAEKDANKLFELCKSYGQAESKFETEWLNAIEEIIPSLPSALAYLSLFEPDIFETVSTCLVSWSRTGLQLDSALRQPDSVDILRHLRVGIDLTGVLLSIISSSIPSTFQLFDILLDLFESPLISSPLRLEIIVALERSLSTGVSGFKALLSERKGSDNTLPPYQRIVKFLTGTNKSVPVSLACNRLLAKVRFYDTLLQFDDFMKSLKTSTSGVTSVKEVIEREKTLAIFLSTISRAISDPGASPLPKDVARLQFMKQTSDLCSVLYKLLDSIHLLDHIVWLLEQQQSAKPTKMTSEQSTQGILSALLSTSAGLLFLASSPASASRIVRALVLPVSPPSSQQSQLSSKQQLHPLGGEMVVKLETLACVDRLISLTRRSGETGLHRYFSSATSSAPDDSDELYNAVFSLARLFLSPDCASWAAEVLSANQGKAEPTSIKMEEEPETDTSPSKTRNGSLSRLGLSEGKIEIESLLCTIAIGVLRHASNPAYLERFAPRLLRIIQNTQLEDRVSSLSPSELFSYQRSFISAGTPWLSWLRDAPSAAISIPESCELFSWYCDQVAPLTEVLEDSTQPPPSLLLLLRFIRYNLSDLEVIELYAKDGLPGISSLVDITAERLMLPSSVENPVAGLLMDMMAEGVAILDVFVNALVDGIGDDFRDRTPVMPVCKAYAAASALKNKGTSGKIQKRALNCISAYANACQDEEIPEGTYFKMFLFLFAGSVKDIWSSVCRDIFAFTTSSPVFFLPGLQLLLDLLPLPLPVALFDELSPSDRRSLLSKRDWWCRRLTRDLPTEVCGLLEILSASPPHTSLHRHLVLFLERIVSLGPSSTSLCQMIASSAVETVVEVYTTAGTDVNNPNSDIFDADTHQLEFGDSVELPSLSALKTLTARTRLVLGSQQPPTVSDQLISSSTNEDDDKFTTFGSISNVSEITHSLAYLHLIVRLPIGKQALLDLTRKERFKEHRILKIFSSIMEGLYHDESPYFSAQIKLLDCIECLLDSSLGLGKASEIVFDLTNHLPSVEWTSDLIGCLLTHLHPIGRASTTSADRILRILNRLALHDFGFAIIQRHLCQKQHERVFANLLQGLVDNLNSANVSIICQTNLRNFILFASTLLADPIVADEALLAASADTSAVSALSERHLRLPTLRLRQLLHGGTKSESLLKEVVFRLECRLKFCEICLLIGYNY
ncbi:unnamed protein product [Rodentolepis nana]|uniref:VIR_N domain-containing protein n=1 Tax=Rodentolepis nana TaxID=102285 RepID=A0A0R3T4I5_RODNA|nr:unnamed protein product [Rodentolepis nana]